MQPLKRNRGKRLRQSAIRLSWLKNVVPAQAGIHAELALMRTYQW
jgi:hypothetical protein